jgi:hypothetical protein
VRWLRYGHFSPVLPSSGEDGGGNRQDSITFGLPIAMTGLVFSSRPKFASLQRIMKKVHLKRTAVSKKPFINGFLLNPCF